MKNNTGKGYALVAGMIICILFSGSLSSCRSNKGREGLIPEKTFSSILYDIYLSDGLLSMSAIRDLYSRKDSIAAYVDIVNSYGYSYDQMENTLGYYFREDPKRLVKIYDRIEEKMSTLEMHVTAQQENALAAMTAKMKKNDSFLLPDPGVNKKPDFSYDIYPPGVFTLEFSVTLYPDDRSVNPAFTAWYRDAAGPDTSKCTYFLPVKYFKDGLPHVYTIRGHVIGRKKSVLKGYYLDYENDLLPGRLHANIRNLTFNYVGDNI